MLHYCTLAVSAFCFFGSSSAWNHDKRKTCVVKPSGTNTTDDAPAILRAFKKCGRKGRVVFKPTTYYVNSVLNITGLNDVEIDLYGRLLWSTDIAYWLDNSLDVGYQNHSTSFILGGKNVVLDGHGKGTFDGNGDYWYQWIQEQENTSNYPGRPHQLTLNGLKDSVLRGLTFLRSQMWTMSIIYSHNVELSNILVNNTGNVVDSSNTDGADTIRSSKIRFDRWEVYNGDDSIAIKANSTDVSITNSVFHDGLGVALGSIGQYYGEFETIEGLHVENITFHNTLHAAYVKTWTGDQNGYPPNGGGGGLGCNWPKNPWSERTVTKDITFRNLTSYGMRGSAVSVSQCTRFIGAPGDGNCTNSQFRVNNITVDGLKGTTRSSRVASFQCSAVAPCTNLRLDNIDLRFDNGTAAPQYLCGNVFEPKGFECTGKACEGGSSTGGC
ncbi:LOW QUALITY PROTEIN: exo-rhamnogalacturonase B [Paramyrothecium foliicola]|nr:LOW QUALITY PROTEIN: exo-rhamnogalacturonase B [Paramyrothecium foliicola]